MIAERVSKLSPSETLKITARAKELQNNGKPIISLSQGEPDFRTPDYICEAAIKAIHEGFHGYTVNTGTIELRRLICEKLKRDNGYVFDTNQIVVSNGAKQSIGFSILATVNPGEEVIVPAPYWVSYPEMIKLAGGVPKVVRTGFDQKYKLTPDQLREAITDNTRMLMLCSPSNPTGSCYTEKELSELAEVLKEYPKVYILSDEIYEYITFNGGHISPGNVIPELKDRILVVNGFSKGFAMTGWRLGYLAAPENVAGAVAKIQSQITSGPSSISQKAGEAAYKNDLEVIYQMREAFQQRRDYLVHELNQIEGVKCFSPDGAFYAFPDISAWLGSATPDGTLLNSSTDLCMYLLENFGLALVPGDAFGEPNGIRLSYAASMEELENAIIILKKCFAGLQM